MKKIRFALIGLLVGFTLHTAAQAKTKLRVLYVGGTANFETSGGRDNNLADVEKSVQERMADFGHFLNQYFTMVKVVKGSDYTASMSNDYDITIFDGTPKPLKERRTTYDSDGNYVTMENAEYLPADFHRPCLMIANMSESIGRPLGDKNDWYCLCLEDDAHHWKANHPIFKGPYKVSLNVRDQKTPNGIYEYHYFYPEVTIPASIPMWQVQNYTEAEQKTKRIGMVARPWGYLDSPDCEVISSGVCAKTIDAVAIGRHGNFFHWGFAASPKHMTDQAKIVFANAVIYASQFDKAPIVRKFNERIATREYIKECVYLTTRQATLDRAKMDKEFNEEGLKSQAVAKAKQAKGEELSQMDKFYLDFKPSQSRTYEQMLQRYAGDLYKLYGTDEKKYSDYYKENYPYFYGGNGVYELSIDEDCKKLGIANNDIRILDAAIKLWESGKDEAMAHRLLNRYTLCRFNTAKEYRDWYKKYRKLLFFTESGGWFWMVNSTEPNTPGNDYDVVSKDFLLGNTGTKYARPSAQTPVPTPQQPVYINGKVEKVGGKTYVVIQMNILAGWHTYATVDSKDSYLPTEIKIQPGDGYKLVGNLDRPAVAPLNQGATTIYEDNVEFRQQIEGDGPTIATATVNYQTCDSHTCLQPTEKTITFKNQR